MKWSLSVALVVVCVQVVSAQRLDSELTFSVGSAFGEAQGTTPVRIDPARASLFFTDPPAAENIQSFTARIYESAGLTPVISAVDVPIATATLAAGERRVAFTSLPGFATYAYDPAKTYTVRLTVTNDFALVSPEGISDPFVKAVSPSAPRVRVGR